MSTTRMLPLGIPVAAGIATTADGAVILLGILSLIGMLLVVRSLALRGGIPDQTTEGPRR